jgi:hypothetical protein
MREYIPFNRPMVFGIVMIMDSGETYEET